MRALSGPIAQLGERCVRNAEVGSSILLRSTKFKGSDVLRAFFLPEILARCGVPASPAVVDAPPEGAESATFLTRTVHFACSNCDCHETLVSQYQLLTRDSSSTTRQAVPFLRLHGRGREIRPMASKKTTPDRMRRQQDVPWCLRFTQIDGSLVVALNTCRLDARHQTDDKPARLSRPGVPSDFARTCLRSITT